MPSLEEILHPPATRPAPIDWAAVERELGSELPADYKTFVSRYGAGMIDGFLGIFTPGGRTEWVDIVWRSRDHDDIFFRRSETHEPFEAFPAPGGLMAFGQTENGDTLYWRTAGAPSEWTVLVYEGRGPEYFEFAGSMTSFLEGILTRRIRVTMFSDGFPSDAPRFASY